ncbi:restriction endonuclease subunit S [Megasphaera stantonii]|uniref:restriction endonuclease subunit S n=1 Tax=Megasphaera stantonii TaxID=2144175 RepID=UPI001DAD3C3D|nr:restriction endonuclease subunit S [Megasphaera stantonii]HJE82890.1 restriction endonuclease subunit S [Megasphaera stantonii]
MMGEEMHEKKRVPAIRFAGFTEPWEQRKFGDLYERVTEKNDLTYGIDKSITVASMQYKKDGCITNEDYLRTYTICLLGDIVFEGHQSKQFRFGRFVENDLGNGIVSHIFMVFRPKTDYDLYFWKYAINNEQLMRKILSHCTKASRMMNDLVIQDFFKESMPVPTINEQQMIGHFFYKLDQLITLHQRKCDALKKVKKSLLQKMFPKEGSVVPEIRFAGFTEAWKQRELGNFIIEYTEVTTENNQYPALTSSRKGIFLQTDYFSGNQIASEDNTGYNIVPYGYFTYRHMSDDEIFYFNINNIVENGIVSTLYPVFTTNIELDSKYLQYQLNYGYEFAKFARLQKQGGSRTYMYLNKLKKLRITIPLSIKEQKSISKVLLELDRIITLHQRKLDQLKTIKKSLLQQMFV